MSEKLQKVLARVGLGSRRHMEEVISAGRVSVNGKIATLGDRIEATDELRIDGRKVSFQVESEIRRRVIIYYKPEGEICSRHDPDNRPTVFDQLPTIANDRWVMVGRLDINSTGLLLFTNDGELANRLMHPSNQIEREYAVRVMGEVTPDIQRNLTQGVVLEDGPAKFESFSELGGEGINRWYQVVVKEGRNREVRRMFESQNLKVSRLLRTRYGTIKLPRELRTGRWIELDRNAIDALSQSVELRPRQGTGLFGLAKRRAEKMQDNPLPARREPRRLPRRSEAAPETPQQPEARPPRRNAFRTARRADNQPDSRTEHRSHAEHRNAENRNAEHRNFEHRENSNHRFERNTSTSRDNNENRGNGDRRAEYPNEHHGNHFDKNNTNTRRSPRANPYRQRDRQRGEVQAEIGLTQRPPRRSKARSD